VEWIIGGSDSLQFYSSGSGSGGNYAYSGSSFQQPSTSSLAGAYGSQREFVGSPFGSGGYSDEPPLLEGNSLP
jgi:hypothetical protein